MLGLRTQRSDVRSIPIRRARLGAKSKQVDPETARLDLLPDCTQRAQFAVPSALPEQELLVDSSFQFSSYRDMVAMAISPVCVVRILKPALPSSYLSSTAPRRPRDLNCSL